MTRLVLATMIWVLVGAPSPPQAQAPAHADPARAREADRLYADREELASALEAARLWDARLAADATDFEAGWKLARASYWLGSHVPKPEQQREHDRGIDAGRKAVAAQPGRPEGHFWLAAAMGAMAETAGLRAGLRYRGQIKRELEAVLAMSPEYDLGAADRALSRWYLKVPPLFGGSKERSLQHLQQSLRHDHSNAATHYFFAETYLALDKRDEARRSFERVLDAPSDGDWAPEVREFKARARQRLTTLQ